MALWYEPLPEQCPPNDAKKPQNDIVYRAVQSNPPIDSDFISHRAIWPHKIFKVSECRARSVSVFTEVDACINLTKLPKQKGKIVAKMILPPQSGVIKRTGRCRSHMSWWRAASFDPIQVCTIILTNHDN